MINFVVIIGRIGFLEVENNNGKSYTKLSVATNEQWKDKTTGEKQQKTTWHNVTGYNKLGEIIAQYAKVGDTVCIIGKINQNKYKDKNGVDKISTTIIANEFKIINSSGEKTFQQQSNDVNVNDASGFHDDDIPW